MGRVAAVEAGVLQFQVHDGQLVLVCRDTVQLVSVLAARMVQLVLFADDLAVLWLRDELAPHDRVVGMRRSTLKDDALAHDRRSVLRRFGEPTSHRTR